jgi:uncharacterized protein YjbJ (UPF0337 family)
MCGSAEMWSVQKVKVLRAAHLKEETEMNWDQVEGTWKQSKGKIRQKWGKLTDDDLEVIAGKRDQLIGRLQVRYGIAREEAEKQADAFVKGLAELEKTTHQ